VDDRGTLRAITRTEEIQMAVTTQQPADATAIRPFTIELPDAEIEELRARIAARRWPEMETVADTSPTRCGRRSNQCGDERSAHV
jgi:hypothetical protein